MTRVAVLGAGSWGTTIAAQLSRKVETVLWARTEAVASEIRDGSTNHAYLGERALPAALEATAHLDDALRGASLVIVAVPSYGVRAVLERAEASGAVPGADVPVLSLTKGLEHSSLLRITEVLAACWPGHPLAVLTGPNLATEVFDGQPTASVVGSGDEALALEIQELLRTDAMRVYTNGDVIGCEVAGVVKNVMAIATGMAVGLGLGENARAALITRALAELTRLGVSLGGQATTFTGLAGVGDLVATCTSTKSRNFATGVALGRGHPLSKIVSGTPMIAEGIHSCRAVVALAEQHNVEVPVAEQVVAVCHGGCAPAETIFRLMSRAPRAEQDGLSWRDRGG